MKPENFDPEAAREIRETNAAWFAAFEKARIGKHAEKPDLNRAYKTARVLKLAAGVKGTREIEAARDELIRRAKRAKRDAAPKAAREIREAGLAIKERLAKKLGPAKRMRYKILRLYNGLSRDGRPPTQGQLWEALTAEDCSLQESDARRVFRLLKIRFTPANRGPKKSSK